MTIDEAIEKYNNIANDCSDHCMRYCDECANECGQIAEWLEELKDYRDKNKMVVRIDCISSEEFNDLAVKLAKEQYNKALDDFVNACKEDILCQTFGLHQNGIEHIAKQLRAGGTE